MSRQATGLRAWLLQRLTSLYLAGYFIYLIAWFIMSPPQDHAAWQAWISDPINSVGLMLFLVTLLMHAWVGIRDVLIDYLPIFGLRLAFLTLFAFMLVACGLWAMRIILAPLII